MKKVLFVCNPCQIGFMEEIGKRLQGKNLFFKGVDHETGLVEFLSDDWDIIFCIAEPKAIVSKVSGSIWRKGYSVFKDIERSKQNNQKLYRLGFVGKVEEEGDTPFIEMPFTFEKLIECCE